MPKQVASGGRGAERLDLGRPFEEYPLAVLGMIGKMILPIFPVSKKAAAVSVITREGLLRRRDVRRADGSNFSRDTFDVDELTYNCVGYGHEQFVTKAMREVYRNDFDADTYAQGMVQRILDTELEIRIAAEIFDGTTNWPSGTAALYTDVSTDWDNTASTIIADVEGAKEKVRDNCGMEANTLVVSSAHLKSLKTNVIIKAMFPGIDVLTDVALFSNLSAIFGIPNILIGSGVYNAGGEGATLSMTKIWSDDYCWVGVVPQSGDLVEPGVGRTMQWDAFGADGYEWNMYTEPQTKTDVWQGEHYVDEKVFDAYFGHLLLIDT
uniref:Putative capsid protein n=1 Tax=viral metagenome TaxID=1070528 RepID=A0A6M3K7I2_9ZZZZ